MTTKVFLTLDTFFHNWESKHRNAWLGIQPYINGSPEDIVDWIKKDNNIFDGNDSIFTVAQPGDISPHAVPVPLPGSLDVSVKLYDDNDKQLDEITIKREQHCLLTNAERFRALNEFSSQQSVKGSMGEKFAENSAYPLVFADTLLRSIQPQRRADDPAPILPLQLVENLQLKFELGQRQKFDDECLVEVGHYYNAAHQHDDPEIQVTNTHYLLGQLVNLGQDINQLQRVASIRLFIGKQEIDIPDKQRTTARIFGSIKSTFDLGDFKQTIKWSEKLASRVNAKVQGDTFTVNKLPVTDRFLWRLSNKDLERSQSQIGSDNVRWSAFERLDIREKADVTSSLLTQPASNSLTFTPALVLDVELVRYRKTPEVMPDSSERYPINSMAVSVKPSAADRPRFDNLVKHHSDLLRFAQFYVQQAELQDDANNTTTANYQLTPAISHAYDFDWEKDKQFLLLFNTGQEESTRGFPDQIIFDFNKHVYQKAQLVIPLDRELTLNRAGIVNERNRLVPDRTDPFGPRWELWHEAASRRYPDFNGLMCAELDQTDIDLDQLIVSVFHNDKYDYELAQSARRLETVINVSFNNIRESDPKTPKSFDFHQTVLEDKTNHNQLNLFEWRNDFTLSEDGLDQEIRVEHRNNGSALPCIKVIEENAHDPLKKHLHYTFMAVLKDSTSAPMNTSDAYLQKQVKSQLGKDGFAVRDFYVDVYENLGDGRNVTFNLEHTYGSCIMEQHVKAVPNCIDEPILLASDVAFAPAADNPNADKVNLFEISLDENNGRETVFLHINRELLEADWINKELSGDADSKRRQSEARSLAHIQAWQAFAELYYADSVKIIAECYEFDNSRISIDNPLPPIQQGLTCQTFVLAELSSEVEALAHTAFIDLDNMKDQLSQRTNGRWSQDYHAVRFRLDVNRRSEVVPNDDPGEWQVHRRLARMHEDGIEELYTQDGVATESLNSATVKRQLASFLARLRKRGGYLTPKGIAEDKQRNEQFFALLGEGKHFADVSPETNAWIVPPSLKQESGKIQVAYCPVGIMPVAPDPTLKSTTAGIMKRYFDALQSVVDFQQYTWFRESAANLHARLDGFSKGQQDSLYPRLIAAAESKFRAIPDHTVDGDKLNEPVRQLAGAIQTDDHPINQQLKTNVTTMLSCNPGLFSSLKGLSVAQVSNPELNQPVRRDFFNLYQEKMVDNSNTITGQLATDNLLHVSDTRFTYWELLQDNEYDNAFTVSTLHGESAERVFEQQPVGTEEAALRITTQDNAIFIPDREPAEIGQAEVRLASRHPVTPPTLGSIRKTSIAAAMERGVDLNNPLNLADLLNTKLIESNVETTKTMRAQASLEQPFRNHLDAVTVSAVFTIKGDEETAGNLLSESFANDAFFVLVTDEPLQDSTPTDETLSGSFSELVAMLDSPQPFPLQEHLTDQVLSDLNMRDCIDILERPSIRRMLPNRDDVHKVFSIGAGQQQNTLSVVDRTAEFATANRYDCNVWLFNNQENDTVVWLELELPIWQQRHISLVQTRNQAGIGDTQQQIFAPEFATISQPTGGPVDRMTHLEQLRNEFNADMDSPDFVEVFNHEQTPMEFVRAVIGHRLSGIDESFPGRRCLLNITVKEDSSSTYPSPTATGGVIHVFNGSFARYNHQVYGSKKNDAGNWHGDDLKKKWFGNTVDSGKWRIDFEWRDPDTNDEVLRIEDVPVYLNAG